MKRKQEDNFMETIFDGIMETLTGTEGVATFSIAILLGNAGYLCTADVTDLGLFVVGLSTFLIYLLWLIKKYLKDD